MKKIKKKKNKNIKKNSEYKYFVHDSIAWAVFMVIGMILLMIGIKETFTLLLTFSFAIIMIKMASAALFTGIIRKIVMAIYWLFFSISVLGIILSIINLKPNGYQFDSLNIKDDNKGFISNVEINQNDDKYTIKLIKPTTFTISNGMETDVIYKIDNKNVMYQLYSTNIGLHIF